MPAPLPAPVTSALLAAAGENGERAVDALGALRRAAPEPAVRAAVDRALASDDANLRATALDVLAHHWGTEARPVWKEFLASKSVPLRWAAEEVLGLVGTEDDLAEAAAHLAKLVRTRSKLSMSPPRGNQIVDLLVRHREDPAAQAGLDDLSARWDRLPEDLRGWLAEHHPWLDPGRRADSPRELDAAPEEPAAWPPPTITKENGTLMLEFGEGAAHSDARERFEDLAQAHRAVEVLDGDREWITVRIEHADPEALVRELWDAASAQADASA
jgi:hypothetical protein